jgi:hydrogenase maturation factor
VCVSRLYKVVASNGARWVEVEDVEGHRTRASLLALEGPPPGPGSWVVAHSGYVLTRVDTDEAGAIASQIRAARAAGAAAGERP